MQIVHKNNFSKLALVIIGLLLTYFTVSERWIGADGKAWSRIVDSDGRGYYAYLPSIIIYQDPYFDFVKRDEATIYGNETAEYPYLLSGQRGNRYFIGTALLMAPFFLLAWLVSYLMGFSLNGYNQIFFGSVTVPCKLPPGCCAATSGNKLRSNNRPRVVAGL